MLEPIPAEFKVQPHQRKRNSCISPNLVPADGATQATKSLIYPTDYSCETAAAFD